METHKTNPDKIELRSEKVRQRIGEIPHSLVVSGIVIIVIIIVTLIAVLCLLPYPYSQGQSIIQHMLS